MLGRRDVIVEVQLVERDRLGRRVGFRRKRQRNAVAPAPAHFSGQLLAVDAIFLRRFSQHPLKAGAILGQYAQSDEAAV